MIVSSPPLKGNSAQARGSHISHALLIPAEILRFPLLASPTSAKCRKRQPEAGARVEIPIFTKITIPDSV